MRERLALAVERYDAGDTTSELNTITSWVRGLARRGQEWPLRGQAPSYKLGERSWLQAREDAMARAGAAFSLKGFHAKALRLGAMGLDALREALASV